MPASMISADTGCSAYVVGSSIAIVATGPMPGSTPISVPSSTPTNAYSALTGVSATENPSARCEKSSIARSSARPRPDRQLQLESDHEHADGESCEQDTRDQRLLRPELVACRARRDDQHDGRNRNADRIDDRAEQHDAREHDDRRPEARRRAPSAAGRRAATGKR